LTARPVAYNLVTPTRAFLSPQTFLKQFEFDNDHERQYVRHIAKLALDDRVRIHLLADNANMPLAFIALSFEKIGGNPCLVINYLFCSKPYRKLLINELQNKKISLHLIARAIQLIQEISSNVPLHYLALQPADERLERFYAGIGFVRLHHKEWMFLKI
jgi:hypothetical protein